MLVPPSNASPFQYLLHAVLPTLLEGCSLSVEDPIIVQMRSLVEIGQHCLTLCVDSAVDTQTAMRHSGTTTRNRPV